MRVAFALLTISDRICLGLEPISGKDGGLAPAFLLVRALTLGVVPPPKQILHTTQNACTGDPVSLSCPLADCPSRHCPTQQRKQTPLQTRNEILHSGENSMKSIAGGPPGAIVLHKFSVA